MDSCGPKQGEHDLYQNGLIVADPIFVADTGPGRGLATAAATGIHRG